MAIADGPPTLDVYNTHFWNWQERSDGFGPCQEGASFWQLDKPIVLVHLTGPGKCFSWNDAFGILKDLEHKMPARNPGCIGELKHRIGNEKLKALQDSVMQAMMGGRLESSHRIVEFNINGTYHRRDPSPDTSCTLCEHSLHSPR